MSVYVDAITKLIDEERDKPFTPVSNGRMEALIEARRAVQDAERSLERRLLEVYEELGVGFG